MSNPIRFGPAAGIASPSARPAAGAGGTAFANRMAPATSALATGVQTIGREVVKVATAGLPPVLQNLAQNAAGAVTGQPDAAMLDVIDKTRFYVMMNAIFDTSNMPVVEKV